MDKMIAEDTERTTELKEVLDDEVVEVDVVLVALVVVTVTVFEEEVLVV